MDTVTRLAVLEASTHMLAGVAPIGAETIALADALGRVLHGDVIAGVALPPWDNSSMDGYAVRAEDIGSASAEQPVTLRDVPQQVLNLLPDDPHRVVVAASSGGILSASSAE